MITELKTVINSNNELVVVWIALALSLNIPCISESCVKIKI